MLNHKHTLYKAAVSSYLHLAIIELAFGYGSYGYEPNVESFFGIPRAIEPGGIAVNVRLARQLGTATPNPQLFQGLNLQSGILSSALEHAVPEQLFVNARHPGEGISAVKALAKANAQGQRIYHLTPANQALTLPNIHHHADTMAEIQAALAAGKEVITHTDAVSVPGWRGAGYIILDLVTGDGAYKISGGKNGGFLYGLIFGVTVWIIFVGLLTRASGLYILLLLIVSLTIEFLSAITIASSDNLSLATKCNFLGAIFGLTIASTWLSEGVSLLLIKIITTTLATATLFTFIPAGPECFL